MPRTGVRTSPSFLRSKISIETIRTYAAASPDEPTYGSLTRRQFCTIVRMCAVYATKEKLGRNTYVTPGLLHMTMSKVIDGELDNWSVLWQMGYDPSDALMEMAHKAEYIRAVDFARVFGCSTRSAYRVAHDLVAKGLLQKVGRGVYVSTKRISEGK